MPQARDESLDGLRAIAVLLVIAWHTLVIRQPSNFAPWAIGPAGVRLFFVLSGYLITGILVEARRRAEREGVSRWAVWRAFYLRRTVRIFPLAYLALAAAWLVNLPGLRAEAGWYAFYASNMFVAQTHQWGALGHFWSLAVEEQFYLVWPLVVLLTPIDRLKHVMVLLIVVSGLCRAAVFAVNPLAAFVLMPTRLDALAFGGFVSIVRVQAWPLVAGGLALFLPGRFALSVLTDEWAMIALSAAAVVGASHTRPLRWRALVWIGGISYGMYVWHPLVPRLVRALERHWAVSYVPLQGAGFFAWVTVVTIGSAAVSWYAWERPWNGLKERWPYVPPGAVQGAAMIESPDTRAQQV